MFFSWSCLSSRAYVNTSTPSAVTGMFPVEAAPSRPQDMAWGKAWSIFCSSVGTTPSGCPAVCSWLWHCFYTVPSLQSLNLEKKHAKVVWFIFARGNSLLLPPLNGFFKISIHHKINVLLRVYLGLLFTCTSYQLKGQSLSWHRQIDIWDGSKCFQRKGMFLFHF